MSQHLLQQDIESYLKRTMSPDELLIADDHLVECDLCFRKITVSKSAPSATVSLQNTFLQNVEDDHLTYQQMASYIDDVTDDIEKEIVEVHKKVCCDCALQLDELIQLREILESEMKTGKTLAAPSSKFSLIELWNQFRAYSFLKFATPAFALILLGIFVWTFWISTKTPRTEIAEVTKPTSNNKIIEPVSETNQTTNFANGNVNSAIANITNSKRVSPRTIVSLNDGNSRIELDENGNIIGLDAPQYEKKIKSALATQNVEITSATKELNAGTGVLMGNAEGVPFVLSNPVGKIVQSDRPQFRWQPFKDAESYIVNIYDVNFNKIESSPPLQKTEWTTNAPLRHGIIYQWQVTAIKDGQEIKSPVRPAPDAKFKVLDAAKANEIEIAKKKYGNSRLLLGILYANAGMLDEAEREFRVLLKKNPKSELARKLLRKVQAR